MNRLYEFVNNNQHHQYRRILDWKPANDFALQGLTPKQRMTLRFERLCKEETPVLLPDEKICFMRTIKNIPEIFTESEWKRVKEKHFVHELGFLSNLTPDYEKILKKGLCSLLADADEYGKRSVNALLSLCDRYKEAAIKSGNSELSEILERVPRYGATNFREALQLQRIVHFALWLEGNYHNNLGRFDVYMYPYFKKDMEKGIYTPETALELLEDFFISFNKDSDLYVGVQQGDNGQSMMLGGVDQYGNEVFNELSELCLKASKELMFIDPKINIRVSKKTSDRIFDLGSELTAVGLGFPQYSNDDVVIDGLVKLGYTIEDARNYTVAACWEFIIPGIDATVANIGALSYPKVVNNAFYNSLESSNTFDDFMSNIKFELDNQVEKICDGIKDLWFVPSPFMNVLYGYDISLGGKYNNFGIHGTGIATATDSLAAIKKYVFDEKIISKTDYIKAVESDFANEPNLLHLLRYETPKFGRNNDYVDRIAVNLIDMFADSLYGKTNCRGGIYRAGTGSAMFYLWHAAEIGASPDGRRKGEPFGTNYSPSLFSGNDGVFSVLSSFTKPDLSRVINGGPLTLEFSSSMFSSKDAVHKVGMLVKKFINLGGHQLQLNAVNAEKLRDAQVHPEKYPRLVVRIWGWSAYFVELDKDYQNHVLARTEFLI